MKDKPIEPSRVRARETRKARYGEDTYKEQRSMVRNPYSHFSNPLNAFIAVQKRHHPERIDDQGKLKPEYQWVLDEYLADKETM